MIKGQRIDLGVYGGYLDGNTLDFRILQIFPVDEKALLSFCFPQHRFSQVIDVHANALLLSLVQMRVKRCLLTGNHGAAAALPHPLNHFGNGQRRKMMPDTHEHLNQQFVKVRKEIRDPVVLQDTAYLSETLALSRDRKL